MAAPLWLILTSLLIAGLLSCSNIALAGNVSSGSAVLGNAVAGDEANRTLSYRTVTHFPDMENHWAKDYLMRAAHRSFLEGYPDGTFRPESNITRAEFVKMLVAAFASSSHGDGKPPAPEASPTSAPPSNGIFSDVADHWSSSYVNTALAAGIIVTDDYPGGQFEPDRPVTRLEMTVQLVRALGKQPEAEGADASRQAMAYRDAALIPPRLLGYVGVASGLGIVRGFPDHVFGPERNATRAQAVTMVLRAVDGRDAAEAALQFFRRWGELDLEGMKNLMLVPPERFIPGSDIVFAPFYPKKYPDDLTDFVRSARNLVRQYDPSAWENVTAADSRIDAMASPPRVSVSIRLGNAPYHIRTEMELANEGLATPGWRVRMLDSLPVKSQGMAAPSTYSIEQLQPWDIRDLDGVPGVEILGWAFRGEYEGMGPEPPGTLGVLSFRKNGFERIWLTREGPEQGRVWAGEKAIGHLTSKDGIDLFLVSRPAYLDGKPLREEAPRLEWYRMNLRKGDSPSKDDPPVLQKVTDVAWPSLAPGDTKVHYGLIAARPLDDVPGDELVIFAFCTPPSGNSYQVVAITKLEGNSLRVLTSLTSEPAQSLYMTIAQPNTGPAQSPDSRSSRSDGASHRVYIWAWEDSNVTALKFQEGRLEWVTLPITHQRLIAAADIDGDGLDEFLVEVPRHQLQLVEHDGNLLWKTADYKGAGQAWMGALDGRLVLVMSELGADLNRVVRWEGKAQVARAQGLISLQRAWSGPPLGIAHVSGLWVVDIEGDGDLEVAVTSSDEYLAPADYFHVFDLAG